MNRGMRGLVAAACIAIIAGVGMYFWQIQHTEKAKEAAAQALVDSYTSAEKAKCDRYRTAANGGLGDWSPHYLERKIKECETNGI